MDAITCIAFLSRSAVGNIVLNEMRPGQKSRTWYFHNPTKRGTLEKKYEHRGNTILQGYVVLKMAKTKSIKTEETSRVLNMANMPMLISKAVSFEGEEL